VGTPAPVTDGSTQRLSAARAALLRWFDAAKRPLPWRGLGDPYAIWVSEVMCQQTRVDTASPYFLRWMARFPTVQTLAAASEDDVLRAWQGLGYYRRARALHAAARVVVRDHDGVLPRSVDALRNLPGVGDYTAGAVASIAFGVVAPAVDGNVTRVLARWLDEPRSMEKQALRDLQRVAAAFADAPSPGDVNQALMELGATTCSPKTPRCNQCPLGNTCRAFAAGTIDERPRLPARRSSRVVHQFAFVTTRGGAILVARNHDGRLLAGTWQLPAQEAQDGSDPADAARALFGEGADARPLGRARHLFTHIDLHVTVCELVGTAEIKNGRYAEARFIETAELRDEPQSALLWKLLQAAGLGEATSRDSVRSTALARNSVAR